MERDFFDCEDDKVRLLWLCNIVLPELSDEFGFKKPYAGGWLSGMWNELKKDSRDEMGICVPIKDYSRAKDGTYNNYKYYSFQWQGECDGQDEQIERFKQIIVDFNPDIIHIWGTEYIHANSMIKACKEMNIVEKVLINIQGLLYKCTECYKFGLDLSYSDATIESMEKKQKYEIEDLLMVQYISGRTDWDKESVLHINPKLKYYHCGEILREIFYDNYYWKYDTCDKYTILISQANYPLKGLHLILKPLGMLAKEYPMLKIRICGENPIDNKKIYGKIIQEMIKENDLENTIVFIGPQSEKEMLKEYLTANVFLSSSIIENSSNSICEAISLGVPVVASCVGGTKSIVKNLNNGYLYSLGDEEKAVEYIKMIFENRNIAETLSLNEIKTSKKINDKNKCSESLKTIYNAIFYNN